MALVKCPDCGKMVSSRVTACPDCGCPAEFFLNKEIGSENACSQVNQEEKNSQQNENIFADLKIQQDLYIQDGVEKKQEESVDIDKILNDNTSAFEDKYKDNKTIVKTDYDLSLEQYGINEINFNDICASNYVRIRDILQKVNISDCRLMPADSYYRNVLLAYLSPKFSMMVRSMKIFEGIPSDIDIAGFFNYVKLDINIYPSLVLKNFYSPYAQLSKFDADKMIEKINKKIKKDNVSPILYCLNGLISAKGIVVTNKYIMDVKTGTQILTNEISGVSIKKNEPFDVFICFESAKRRIEVKIDRFSSAFDLDMHGVHFDDSSITIDNTIYCINLIKQLLVRYCGNVLLNTDSNDETSIKLCLTGIEEERIRQRIKLGGDPEGFERRVKMLCK